MVAPFGIHTQPKAVRCHIFMLILLQFNPSKSLPITLMALFLFYFVLVFIIVFRPGLVAVPVQDPGSGFWPGRPGQFSFFFLNQNDVVLVNKKTKVNGLQPGFWPGHTGFFLSLFFLQPGPVPAPDRPARSGRILKLCMFRLPINRSSSIAGSKQCDL